MPKNEDVITAPFENVKNFDYTMVDLFSGIGGTRLGFHQTGRVASIFSSEINKYSIETYKANFNSVPKGDITKIQVDDIPDFDILVAGFPCQAFSQAGKKLGFEDTRGTLFFEIARILEGKRPKAFLLENVRNLIKHNDGKTFNVIMDTLRKLDYEVYYSLLKAKDFGVPQNRERIYIVGFDKTQVNNFKDFTFPTPPRIKTRVKDILEDCVDDKYTISDKLWVGFQNRKARNNKAGKGFGFSLVNEEDSYTNTLLARYYKDGKEILISQEGKNPRRLTPRECARLQGFPDEFIIPVSDTQAYQGFGNSVVVPVIHAIAEEMLKVLDKFGRGL